MNYFKNIRVFIIFLICLPLIVLLSVLFITPNTALAAGVTPNLGQAASFSILSSTYTNTVPGTTINGDLGYTTGPQVAPTVNGVTYIGPSTKYTTAGTDQGVALVDINNQACDFQFADGAIDLATDNTTPAQAVIGVYAPGVYCTGVAGDANIGAGGITLDGAGTYIFKINGALTTTANSVVTLANGASECDVFWAPTEATTLGANSTFVGTDIDASGITIGSTVTWTGRALAYGGTVTTDVDTLTSTTCTAASTVASTTTTSTSTSYDIAPCVDDVLTTVPIIINSSRVSPTSVSLNWGPYTGTDTFTVRYGFENGTWLYSTNVTGFYTTLNDLPANQPIWVQVAERNNCSVGNYSEARLIGGPGLPNSGFRPHENSIQ